MEGGYARWQKEVMEEVHKAVLKGKRVHDDEIVLVPDEVRDHKKVNTDYDSPPCYLQIYWSSPHWIHQALNI